MTQYKVIYDLPIHVDGICRMPNDVFEGDEKTQEIKNLVSNKYIEKVK
jgi:hypothetical protein